MIYRLVLCALVLLGPLAGAASAQTSAPAKRERPIASPLLIVSGGYSSGIKTFGRVSFLSDAADVDMLGYVVDVAAGAGGAQFGFGLGQVYPVTDSRRRIWGLELRGSVTRTFDTPTRMTSRSTYVGFDFTATIENVKASIGYATRVAGADTSDKGVMLWSVSYVVPLWR